MRVCSIFTACVVVSGIIVLAAARAEDKPEPSDELQVLDRYVGDWEETVVNKPALWTPKRTVTTARSTRQWILNGHMVENKGVWSPGNIQFLHLMTYDPQGKEYRQWYFDKSMLGPQDYRGTWDAATQTLTFTSTLSDGVRSVGRQTFLDADTFTWTLVAKDRSGTVVLDMEAKAVRKK